MKQSRTKLTKGGDGGDLPQAVESISVEADLQGTRRWTYRNTAVYPTGAAPEQTIETRNPFDRAHDKKSQGRDPMLIPAAKVGKSGKVSWELGTARPRRYLASEFHTPLVRAGTAPDGSPIMARALVHYEEVFDATHEREKRLADEGLEVQHVKATLYLGRLINRCTTTQLRDFLRPRTRLGFAGGKQ